MFIIFLSFFLMSCGFHEEQTPNISEINVDIKLRRLEKEVFALKTKNDIKNFLNNNPLVANSYFKLSAYPDQSILVEYIHKFLSIKASDTLRIDAERIFGNFNKEINEIEKAFKYLKYYYPDFRVPEIYTSVSAFGAFGFGNDFYISDSVIVIGLDYFGGGTSTYRPPDMPNYILNRYEKEYMIPSLMVLLSQRYNNFNAKDRTLLAEMLFYGKSYYFAKKILPDVQDSIIIGFSSQDIIDVNHNESIIWGHFIEKKLFYETSNQVKNNYLGERPKVLEINSNCPGRIGRWLGWSIIKKYAEEENQQINLSVIMATSNANKTFQLSRYKLGK